MERNVRKVDIEGDLRPENQSQTAQSVVTSTTAMFVEEIPSRFDKRPLSAVFHCATAKVLDFLAMYREFDYTVSDVAKGSGLNLKTASKELENLSTSGLVKFTRKVGRSDMYRINDAGPAKYLLTFVSERIIENLESIDNSAPADTLMSNFKQ